MKKINVRQIGIAGAALLIGAAAIATSQSFANASTTVTPPVVTQSTSGVSSSTPDVAEASDSGETGPDVQQTGDFNDGAPDVVEANDSVDSGE
jgi:uncharacterized protein YggE